MNSLAERTGSQAPKSLSTPLTILLFMLVVSVVLAGFTDEIGNFLQALGNYGIVLSVCLYGLMGASPLPSEPFTVLMASIYGPFPAAFIATTGNFLAALIEYYAGSCLGGMLSAGSANIQIPAWLQQVSFDSPLFLIVGRMLPGAGPKGVSLFCGARHVPLWRYIWTTLISTMIGAVVFAFGGYGLLSTFKSFR